MKNEEVVKYDPKIWNCLALVSPPKISEPYRVMYESSCYLGWWDGYDFWFPEGFSSNPFTKEKILFKPWDNDDDDYCCQNRKGQVTLTVKEAEEIAYTLYAYHELCQKFLIGSIDSFLFKSSKVIHNLDKKIEQTEKSQ